MAVTEARFRALARSSPWRWSTLQFTVRRHPEDPAYGSGVRAWLRRPDRLRVVGLDGDLDVVVREDGPRTLGLLTTDGGRTVPMAAATDVTPIRDAEGLVRGRPWGRFGVDTDAPMFQDYQWVAMLDPVELADGADGEPGTHLDQLREVEHHGRPAWEAIARPARSYDPRCPCCSLLFHAGSLHDVPDEAPSSAEFPDHHTVRLDVETGVCVAVVPVGGSRHGWSHDVAIEAVDEPMPDELFPTGRRRGRWLRRRR